MQEPNPNKTNTRKSSRPKKETKRYGEITNLDFLYSSDDEEPPHKMHASSVAIILPSENANKGHSSLTCTQHHTLCLDQPQQHWLQTTNQNRRTKLTSPTPITTKQAKTTKITSDTSSPTSTNHPRIIRPSRRLDSKTIYVWSINS